MNTNYMKLAQDYYTFISEKNEQGVKSFLHPNVELYSPLATLKGKDSVFKATCNFMKSFNSLKIRTKLGSDNQAMVVYDSDIPGITDHFPGASLLSFQEGLIVKIELFFDGSHFSKMKK